ncbi:hypothetical protein SKAU_G00085400 [Synaphobranchus kaupii]|uniref:Uncharacterized protein n=1 Tax=Synaphobranchus kaupii TaxID=118154 RepID=A0A9Q1FVZ7_SYNKA|nr:hypothetical protein SKAU_G00085400 [Synaphobranchus kaupii]
MVISGWSGSWELDEIFHYQLPQEKGRAFPGLLAPSNTSRFAAVHRRLGARNAEASFASGRSRADGSGLTCDRHGPAFVTQVRGRRAARHLSSVPDVYFPPGACMCTFPSGDLINATSGSSRHGTAASTKRSPEGSCHPPPSRPVILRCPFTLPSRSLVRAGTVGDSEGHYSGGISIARRASHACVGPTWKKTKFPKSQSARAVPAPPVSTPYQPGDDRALRSAPTKRTAARPGVPAHELPVAPV